MCVCVCVCVCVFLNWLACLFVTRSFLIEMIRGFREVLKGSKGKIEFKSRNK